MGWEVRRLGVDDKLAQTVSAPDKEKNDVASKGRRKRLME